jgi:uncharacterized repeat protein (TIGR04052 family)
MRIGTAGALAAAAALASGTASAHAGHHDTMRVAIPFTAVAGSTPVGCSAPITGLGTTGATARLQDLRFYISNVRLVKASGRSVPVTLAKSPFNHTQGANGVTLIDLENGKGACASEGDRRENRLIRGTVPEGKYIGVRMYVSVPEALSHTDITAAPAPLDLAGMAWSWQFGRKFTKIELADPDGAGGTWKDKVFFVHIGSTGCTGNPARGARVRCTDPNRMLIRFPSFDVTKERIAIDLETLTDGNDITVNRAAAPGCMSEATDPECDGVMRAAMGLSWRPDGSGTGRPAGAQTLFRAIPR